MNNLKKYNEIFTEIFNIEEVCLDENFKAEMVEKWDSITQMSLINQLEDCFDIMFEIDDIIGFTSYEGGKQILKKYNIEI